MNVPHPKQKVEQMLGSVDTQQVLKAAARSAVEAALAATPVAAGVAEHAAADDGNGHRRGQSRVGRKLRGAGLVTAGALAGATAVSAAISSARRRDGDGGD